MNESTHKQIERANECCSLVPDSILTAERYELNDIEMEISGELPSSLQGHVFIIAPVGTVNSGGLPFPDGNSFMDGDGMIYRLDFDEPGKVKLKTRLLKPPDYYADKATRPGSKYDKYQFRDYGILRFSFYLGSRDQLNTAFLPMKFRDSKEERLLVTYDAGRPYEIDTETLEVVTPVGSNKEWRSQTNINYPLAPVLSTAHPAFDPRTNEMFTVNYGRSLGNFIQTIPFLYELDRLPQEVDEFLSSLAEVLESDFIVDIFTTFTRFSQNIFRETWQLYANLIERISRIDISNFLYLIRWDGKGNLERWKLVLPDGTPVRIEQTVHQIGITEDYVVLMDTAFKTGLDQVINNPWPKTDRGDRIVRDLLARPIIPDSSIYIVRRRDLEAGQRPECSQQEVTVVARKLVIPMEAAHFLVDYENPNHQIVMHVPHICAWEISEWLRKFDLSAYPPYESVPSRLHSMQLDPMDVSRMGRYTIDGEKAQVIESKVIYDRDCTWGVGLYAYHDGLSSGMPAKKLENIFWSTYGLWKELITKFTFDLYKDYKYRAVPMEEMLRLAEKGIPAYLFRVQALENSINIVDRYKFDCGYMVSSPQFVPCRGEEGEPSSLKGYIVCTVYYKNNNEIWIFDAEELQKGPLCKLSYPSLDFGLTLHTAWLAKIGPRQAEYKISVRQDYKKILKQKSQEIQELFEEKVYPYFDSGISA